MKLFYRYVFSIVELLLIPSCCTRSALDNCVGSPTAPGESVVARCTISRMVVGLDCCLVVFEGGFSLA
jgi:hypothetical protein